MCLLGCQHQCRTKERPDTGRPAYGEDDAEHECRKKAHIVGLYGMTDSLKQGQPKHAEETQTEDNHNQTGNDVKNRLIFLQETADCSRECAEGHKGRSKACDKAESAFERFAGAPFPAAGEIGNIDRQHGKQTGREKGNDSLKKSDYILHSNLHSFRIRCIFLNIFSIIQQIIHILKSFCAFYSYKRRRVIYPHPHFLKQKQTMLLLPYHGNIL